MKYEVVVRHLEHRRVRPYRVYYFDGLGRPVQHGKGWDTHEEAAEAAANFRRWFLEPRTDREAAA